MNTSGLWPFLQGAAFISSLLVAIGPQNAFVLRQGLKRERVLTVAAVSAGCDALLITAGVAGFGGLVSRFPLVTQAAAWGGAAFLGWYALRAFRQAGQAESLEVEAEGGPARSLKAIAAVTTGFSLLNPHVWLDTVVLFGGMAAQQPEALRVMFALGGASASALWFFALAYGARRLSPLFRRPVAWKVLDAGVGVLSLWLAVGLVMGGLHGRP